MATIAEMRRGLGATTIPQDVAMALIKGASPLWLSSDTAAELAADLALSHPPLKRAEVRARAVSGDDAWRLTVVAHDRNGLLADTAAILTARDYHVRGASAATWSELDLALHAITVIGPPPSDEVLDEIGQALRAAGKGTCPTLAFAPTGRAYVSRSGDANGRPMISVIAPGQKGLLATICRWLTDAGVGIEAAWIAGEDEANDVFVVDGDVDVAALERKLTAEDGSLAGAVGDMFRDARDVGETVLRGAVDFVGSLVRRK